MSSFLFPYSLANIKVHPPLESPLFNPLVQNPQPHWSSTLSMITILLLLPVTLAISSHIKASHRVAGVNQVSSVDDSHQLQYAFNASEAREVCGSLGLTIASKAQVQSALTQGFQTCRFGWIDEHFAIIPRVTPSPSCGRDKTGLVEWRTSVRKQFDVFCFNESHVGTQLKDMTSDSPLTANDYQEHSRSPSQQDTTLTSDPLPSTRPHRPSSSSWLSLALLHLPESRVEAQPQPALLLNSTPGIFKEPTKMLLIGITCTLLLAITAFLGYAQLNQSCFRNWDMRPQEEWTETENTCDEY
ncbi:Lymphatic vessel endothelial hyaluronic acid receptor 1 [Merluccius polli]|uniref:Lymphatic vessel endothelial hyaluronic acid receptor 1 n=1 Tax=Merluccius polli TaxID=89951 RepID=A0AA47NY54_MERPO|nr:Lymphatic vessel endothelial hyaluronic acid receptor 1 [Merluccius polli]